MLTDVDEDSLSWDENGNMVTGLTASHKWNWDSKLRTGQVGNDGISCKYAPDGSIVYKESTKNSVTTKRKYIVDTLGEYPVILVELDPSDNNAVKKCYIRTEDQVLMQRDGDMDTGDKYFYLHDRLGSVRALIDTDGDVESQYTYDPFGNHLENNTAGNTDNRYRFGGYKWDSTIGKLNNNARWYDPQTYRFTGRDPVRGEFEEPLTLHAYLYCLNNPINNIDPTGEVVAITTTASAATSAHLRAVGYTAGTMLVSYLAHKAISAINRHNLITNLVIAGSISSTSYFANAIAKKQLETGLAMAAGVCASEPIGKHIPPRLTRGKDFPTELLGYSANDLMNMQKDPKWRKWWKKIKKILKIYKEQKRLGEKY